MIAAYSILSFSWVDLCTASLKYSCGEAVRKVRWEVVRKVRSPFHLRCDTQLKRVKTVTFLHRIQMFPINIFKISHKKHVFTMFTVLALIFVNKSHPFFQHWNELFNGELSTNSYQEFSWGLIQNSVQFDISTSVLWVTELLFSLTFEHQKWISEDFSPDNCQNNNA